MPAKRTTKRILPPQQTKTILSFTASIISGNSDDNLREFMVNYCVEDSTFAVFEKVIPNSGFAGGKFLKETKALNPATNKPYKPTEVEVGRDIDINGWKFHLSKASEGTLKILEAKSDTIFTNSSMASIILPIRQKVGQKGSENYQKMCNEFQQFDPKGFGKISEAQMREVLLNKLGAQLKEQELVLLFRKYQFAGADLFLYKNFIADNF